MVKDHSWMEDAETFLQAKASCISKAHTLKGATAQAKVSNQIIIENMCYELLAQKDIAKILNQKALKAFESKFNSFETGLQEVAQSWRSACANSSTLKYLSCMKKLRRKKTSVYFDAWASISENKNFLNQKEIFVKRSLQKSLVQDRKIASEKNF